MTPASPLSDALTVLISELSVEVVPESVAVAVAVAVADSVALGDSVSRAVSITVALSVSVTWTVSVCLTVSCGMSHNSVSRAPSEESTGGRNHTYSLDDSGWLLEGLGDNQSLEIGRRYNRGLGDDCSLRLRDFLDLGLGLYHLRFDGSTSDSGRDWLRVGLDGAHQSGSVPRTRD
jgi:hypothetical protein